MKKSTAFAVANQQSHKLGKTPKGYGTAEGKREAKAKYDKPKKEYVMGANPGKLNSPKLEGKPKEKEALFGGEAAKSVLKSFPGLKGGTLPFLSRIKKMASVGLGSSLVGIMKQAGSGDDPYLLDQVGKPKVRSKGAVAPNPKFHVKQAMIPSSGQGPGSGLGPGGNAAAKKLKASQKIGVPKMEQPKVKPLTLKMAYATSQYSGSLGPGASLRYGNRQGPIRNPMLRNAGASSEELAMAQKEMKKRDKGWTPLTKAGSMRNELVKLNAVTPQAILGESQRVGAPRKSPLHGVSTQQVAKPVGFGTPDPGTTKPGVQ